MNKEDLKSIIDKMDISGVKNVINEMKKLGVIAADIRVEERGGILEYLGIQIRKVSDIQGILLKSVDACDLCENLWEETEEIKKSVLVGTEFTFRKESYDFTLEELAAGMDEKKAQIADADRAITEWVTKIKGNINRNYSGTKINSIQDLPPHKKHGSEYYNAKKLAFSLYDGTSSDNWPVNFDLDPFCIELQAAPATYDFYYRYQELINKNIFDSTNPWEADTDAETGGGGHISIDVATGFLGNPYYLKNFLVLYTHEVKKGNACLTASEDCWNAPFIHEFLSGGKEVKLQEFIRVVHEFNMLPAEQATFALLKDNISRRVYDQLHRRLAEQRVDVGDAPHYQAVNLEHIIEDDDTRLVERRVELRRFDAQRNVHELLGELDELYELLAKSRTFERLNLDESGNVIKE